MNSLTGNCIVAQSGGPTAVINSSVCGVVQEALKHRSITGVYAARNGIMGILNADIFDLKQEDPLQIERLKTTPSSALGSCRYKLKSPEADDGDFRKIFDNFDRYNIRYFFYIGGNDSQDTADKLNRYAKKLGYDIRIIGIPKTIDNDIVETDHCPGFGSAAKYVATSAMETARDMAAYTSKTIVILEVMGRDAGWLTASSALAARDMGMPDLIYLPEVPFSIEKFSDDVKKLHSQKGQVLVAVSEGIRDSGGKFIYEIDAWSGHDIFGHSQLGGVGSVLAAFVKENIEKRVRAIELSTLQRSAAHCLSSVDAAEAYMVGQKAVLYAVEGHSGYMVALHRESQNPYKSTTRLVELSKVANLKKPIPREWINSEGNYVTQEAVDYIAPLVKGSVQVPEVDGLPVYAKLKKVSL